MPSMLEALGSNEQDSDERKMFSVFLITILFHEIGNYFFFFKRGVGELSIGNFSSTLFL
jgi:hypothetical protein